MIASKKFTSNLASISTKCNGPSSTLSLIIRIAQLSNLTAIEMVFPTDIIYCNDGEFTFCSDALDQNNQSDGYCKIIIMPKHGFNLQTLMNERKK